MIKPKPPPSWPATEVIEEAVGVLRRTPASTVLCSFIGGVPFWLTLLYYFADMGHSFYAEEHLAGASLSLAALYLWKKCWEAVFASGLRSVLAGEEEAPWTMARTIRLVLAQAELQFWGLLIRPLAYNMLLPTAWISAFYLNITALGDGRETEAGSLSSRAWTQARLWPAQNHVLIGILSFMFFVVWVNVSAVCAVIPYLLKSFFGIETMASRDYSSYLSTTFFAATFALSWLLLDPIWRAAYVVRCYHGASLHTGADIRAGLRALRTRAGALAMLLMLGFSTIAPGAMKTAQPPAATVDPVALDRSIERTLERREFAWRFRKLDTEADKPGLLDGWLRSIKKWLQKQWEWIIEKFYRFLRWLRHRFRSEDKPSASGRHFEISPQEAVLYGSAIVAAVLLGWAVWIWLRRPRKKVVIAQAVAPALDLDAADLLADQLPEDGWMTLARELAARGELRLALRAVYLATLAYLGEQQFVSIARHKSNLDYQRELRRRARARAELLAAFDENLAEFERAWYGDHRVTLPIFEQFTQNLERMRAC